MNEKKQSGLPRRGVRGETGGPILSRINEADLRSPDRLVRLFDQAVSAELVQRTQDDLLRFVALACRCRRLATRNPAGMFSRALHRKQWKYITERDRRDAVAVLRRLNSGDQQ